MIAQKSWDCTEFIFLEENWFSNIIGMYVDQVEYCFAARQRMKTTLYAAGSSLHCLLAVKSQQSVGQKIQCRMAKGDVEGKFSNMTLSLMKRTSDVQYTVVSS